MKVILKRRNSDIFAIGEFDTSTKAIIVKKGAVVSDAIHYTEKFRGSRTIEELRERYVVDRKTTQDITFNSASTAANFVTGGSTNGLIAWKTESGISIREAMKK